MKLTELHMREWIHTHTIDGHIGHWICTPRFWAMAALIILMALLIAVALFTKPSSNGIRPPYPMYPYVH